MLSGVGSLGVVALGSDQACDDSLSALECLLERSLEQTLERPMICHSQM